MKKFMNFRFRLLKNQKGMTLIELLAVVVVLGVIAAIAVPAIGATISSTKTKADTNTETVIKEAALRYLYDTYPNGTSTTISPLGISSVLSAKNYLSSDFNAQKQVASGTSTVYFSTVDVTYDATSGWSVGAVNTSTTTG